MMKKNIYTGRESFTEISEAIEAFGLNFEVVKKPLQFNAGGFQSVPDKMVTVRTDRKENNYLGIVGSSYEVVQNLQHFEPFQDFANNGIMTFENGGYFGNGERTFVQGILPNALVINEDTGDVTVKYITVCSSHDGTIALQVFITPIRIICHNTFMYAIKSGEHKVKIKHTKTAKNRLVDAVQLINNALEAYNEYDEFVLASTKTREFNSKEVENFVNLILPQEGKELSTRRKNQRFELIETINSGIGQKEIEKMNLYKLWNGVTCWTNNVLPSEKKDTLEFVTYATGEKINTFAFGLAQNILKNDMVLA